MDSMRTHVESTLSLHGLHEDSMRTPWILEGVHGCISYSLHRVHMDSMWSPHGVQRDSPKYSGLHGESTMDSVETPCGLSVDSSWISVDSMRTATLIYLINKKLIIFKNKYSQRGSNSGPFGRCITTPQPAELTGHVSI